MKETTRIIEVLKRVDEITSIKTKSEMYCLHYMIFVSKDIVNSQDGKRVGTIFIHQHQSCPFPNTQH